MKIIYEAVACENIHRAEDGQLVIWGAGNIGLDILTTLETYDIKVNYFCDSDVAKTNQKINGVTCISPTELSEIPGDICVVAAVNSDLKPGLLKQIKKYDADWIVYADFSTGDAFLADKLQAEYQTNRVVLKDVKSQFVNIINHVRSTLDQPTAYKNIIYIFGDSRLLGGITSDANTIASILQKKLNQEQMPYKVENHASIGDCIYSQITKIKELNLNENDIIFCPISFWPDETKDWEMRKLNIVGAEYIVELNQYCIEKGAILFLVILPNVFQIINPSALEDEMKRESKRLFRTLENDYMHKNIFCISQEIIDYCICRGVKTCDVSTALHRPHDLGEIFEDYCHCNANANGAFAIRFLDYVKMLHVRVNDGIKEDCSNYMKNRISSFSKSIEFLNFIDDLKQINEKLCGSLRKKGAVVMNCNPFTNGHKYLIEQAVALCDFLYIFVLEEDASFFSYRDRIDMVRKGTEELKSTCVLPGGKFIISTLTFPQYFNKEVGKNAIDASSDLSIFAKDIAPALDISIRFVGNEPFCKVTKEYNSQMKYILEQFNIDVIEIPRLEFENEPISATQVREYYNNNCFDKIKRIVPRTTYEHLEELKKYELRGSQL